MVPRRLTQRSAHPEATSDEQADATRQGAPISPIHETEPARPLYRRLLRGPTLLLAAVVLGRFVLEAAGLPLDTTRFLSANVVGALAIIYVGAVAPLCGVTRFRQLAFPAFIAIGPSRW